MRRAIPVNAVVEIELTAEWVSGICYFLTKLTRHLQDVTTDVRILKTSTIGFMNSYED